MKGLLMMKKFIGLILSAVVMISMFAIIPSASAEEFSKTLDEAKEWADSVGYKESDVNDIIKTVRKKKRK